MKAITLTQPWATLVALGAKKIETRSWDTKYRGPLAIHAAKGFSAWAKDQCFEKVFSDVLLGAKLPWGTILTLPDLHLGYVIATCELVRIDRIKGEDYCIHVTRNERAFGDFSVGRFAWYLENIQPLPKPIPARGSLRLWEWQDPGTDSEEVTLSFTKFVSGQTDEF